MRIDLHVPGARSLKEKRAVVRPLVEGARHRFRCAVAEVDHQDRWQRTVLGFAVVSGSASHATDVIDEVERLVWSQRGWRWCEPSARGSTRTEGESVGEGEEVLAGLERRELSEPDAAIDTYRSALEVDDRDAVSLDALTELYRERKRWDDLVELYLRRAELADTPAHGIGYRLALARLHLELGQTDRAIREFETLAVLAPDDDDAALAFAKLLIAANRKDDAKKQLERVVKRRADDKEVQELKKSLGAP